jgi:hypothetical protein
MSEGQEEIKQFIGDLDAKPMTQLLEESGQELPNLMDMSTTIGVLFDRAVKNFSPAGTEDPSLETVEDPKMRELMCLINLQDLHQKGLTTVVVLQHALIKRLSCLYHDK